MSLRKYYTFSAKSMHLMQMIYAYIYYFVFEKQIWSMHVGCNTFVLLLIN